MVHHRSELNLVLQKLFTCVMSHCVLELNLALQNYLHVYVSELNLALQQLFTCMRSHYVTEFNLTLQKLFACIIIGYRTVW